MEAQETVLLMTMLMDMLKDNMELARIQVSLLIIEIEEINQLTEEIGMESVNKTKLSTIIMSGLVRVISKDTEELKSILEVIDMELMDKYTLLMEEEDKPPSDIMEEIEGKIRSGEGILEERVIKEEMFGMIIILLMEVLMEGLVGKDLRIKEVEVMG